MSQGTFSVTNWQTRTVILSLVVCSLSVCLFGFNVPSCWTGYIKPEQPCCTKIKRKPERKKNLNEIMTRSQGQSNPSDMQKKLQKHAPFFSPCYFYIVGCHPSVVLAIVLPQRASRTRSSCCDVNFPSGHAGLSILPAKALTTSPDGTGSR